MERVLAGAGDIHEIFEQALSKYLSKSGAERGCILLERPGEAPHLIHRGPVELATRFPFSRTVVDFVLDEQRGLFAFDSAEESLTSDSESLKAGGARSFVCTPIQDEGVHLGVIYLDNPSAKGVFSKESLEDLQQFAKLLVKYISKQPI